MEPTVLTSAGLAALLGNLTAAAPGGAGKLAGAKLKLFTNNVNPGKAAVIGSFTLATFTGSAPISQATWGEVYIDPSGDAVQLGSLAQWDWDSGDAETVYGIVLTDSADALLGYARFTTPKMMDDTADSLAVVPKFTYGDTDYGTFVRAA